MKKIITPLLATAALAIAGCAETVETDVAVEEDTTADAMANDTADGTIVDVASANGDFSTLVSAITAAELGETLSGEGPFTVFAPTNAAFEKLPEGTLDNLTQPENKETLTGILTYHVVPGNQTAADLTTAIGEADGGTFTLDTVNGEELTAAIVDGNVILTDAAGGTSTVTSTDIEGSNGVIHVIDTVLMPS